MPGTKFDDLAEYRFEILAKRKRDSDGRDVYVHTGWSVVKYPWTDHEGFEPMDSPVGSGQYQSDFKQYNGFIIIEDNHVLLLNNEAVVGGDVGLPRSSS